MTSSPQALPRTSLELPTASVLLSFPFFRRLRKSPLNDNAMLLSPILTSDNLVLTAEVLGICFALYCFGCAVYNRYFHPYKDFPGPFWASITPLWYFRAVRYGRGQDHQLPLHKRYGSFVRIAPDQIQIMDPAAIETVVRAYRCVDNCADAASTAPRTSLSSLSSTKASIPRLLTVVEISKKRMSASILCVDASWPLCTLKRPYLILNHVSTV